MQALLPIFLFAVGTILAIVSIAAIITLSVLSLLPIGAGYGFYYMLLYRKKHHLLDNTLKNSELLSIFFDGVDINYTLDAQKLKDSPENNTYIILSAIAGLVIAEVFLIILKYSGSYANIPFLDGPIYEQISFFVGSMIVFIVCLIAIGLTSSSFSMYIEGKIKEKVKILKNKVSLPEKLWKLLDNSYCLCNEIGIPEYKDYFPRTNTYINSNLYELLRENKDFKEATISNDMHQLEENNENLKLAINNYNTATKIFERTANFADRTKNKEIFYSLDKIARGILGAKKHLEDRNWQDFNDVILFAQKELQDLYDNGSNYDDEENTDKSFRSGKNTLDIFAVLGITQDMSNEKIKQVYRKLATIYHPDKGLVSDSEKFKQIQSAYEEIRKIRCF